jgi:hypothetical protein
LIDGVKIYCRISDFETWKKAANVNLTISIDNETGAVKEKIRYYPGGVQKTVTYKGSFETYHFIIKQTTNTVNGKEIVTHLLIINGSLHKNHFNGTNYLRFTWNDLQTQVKTH